jgi:pSer/pThr/pTyr-binding forkhead associated (FHA) protein
MPSIPAIKATSSPTLPSNAPRVRITAGVGTVNQKTWNLRRPVTVIGSGPQCHILLPGSAVEKAHCALLHNGAQVLLKDLCTPGGTRCRGEAIDLRVLQDGDVVEIGDFRVQIAIRSADLRKEDTVAGIRLDDPETLAPAGIRLRGAGIEGTFRADGPVCLAGRRAGTDLTLDHPEVSLAHALFFSFEGRPAVADLGSRTGTWVNGERQPVSYLRPGDVLRIGPCETTVGGGRGVPSIAMGRPEAMADAEADLAAREQRLSEREAALDRKLLYLSELEKSLKRREEKIQELACRAREIQTPLPPPPAEPGPPFAPIIPTQGMVIHEPAPADASPATDAIDRAWRIIHRGNA